MKIEIGKKLKSRMVEKKQKTPQIEIKYRWEASEEYFAPGVLIYVKNGRGELYTVYTDETKEKVYYDLILKDQLLFQLQGSEYFCPTCEKIVRTAYQLEQTNEFHMKKINREDASFKDIIDELQPLLGLLDSGYYCLWDTEIYPTDGNGNLFWDIPNDDVVKKGSCVYYRGDGEWGTCWPHFTVATQPRRNLSEERLEYYREHVDCRAVAFYIDGNLTALIDGHHKALAAAMEHRMVKTVVISPCYQVCMRMEDGSQKTVLRANDVDFVCKEMKLPEEEMMGMKRLERTEYPTHLGYIQTKKDKFQFDIDTKMLAGYYPSVEECAAMDDFGIITDELINQFLSRKKVYDEQEMCTFLEALGGQRHQRLFEIVDYTLHQLEYQQTEIMLMAIKQLKKIPRTEQLESYLIEYMTEIEDEYTVVGKYILEYL